MTRRRVRGKRRRRGTKPTDSSALAGPGHPDVLGPLSGEPLADSIAIPVPDDEDEDEMRVAPSALDALLPEAAVAQAASAREPPRLIVDTPQRVAARRARDQRDGVQVADPRRRGLYLGIAVFVAVVVLVFVVLSLIDSRDLMPSLFPAP